MSNSTINIATTILNQLGGTNRLSIMTGAKNFVATANGATFKIGKNAKKVTHVTIILDASDTYTVNFQRVTKRGLEVKDLNTVDGVYADMLVDIFESNTGLYLSF